MQFTELRGTAGMYRNWKVTISEVPVFPLCFGEKEKFKGEKFFFENFFVRIIVEQEKCLVLLSAYYDYERTQQKTLPER